MSGITIMQIEDFYNELLWKIEESKDNGELYIADNNYKFEFLHKKLFKILIELSQNKFSTQLFLDF